MNKATALVLAAVFLAAGCGGGKIKIQSEAKPGRGFVYGYIMTPAGGPGKVQSSAGHPHVRQDGIFFLENAKTGPQTLAGFELFQGGFDLTGGGRQVYMMVPMNKMWNREAWKQWTFNVKEGEATYFGAYSVVKETAGIFVGGFGLKKNARPAAEIVRELLAMEQFKGSDWEPILEKELARQSR